MQGLEAPRPLNQSEQTHFLCVIYQFRRKCQPDNLHAFNLNKRRVCIIHASISTWIMCQLGFDKCYISYLYEFIKNKPVNKEHTYLKRRSTRKVLLHASCFRSTQKDIFTVDVGSEVHEGSLRSASVWLQCLQLIMYVIMVVVITQTKLCLHKM